jgi:hypothetical protein
MEMEMETETNMETETDMETEMETDNTWKWTWTWNWRTFAKYFIRRNSPNSTIEILQCNFHWRYIRVEPLHNGNNDKKIF